ncbi:hypothetical protein [Streptomyces albipurpureus]|uniref:C2H2-type domain-containing protein n=1 Tax=Streptomyces albipurpureus TaxID=2897419 RepID=A0ABT0UMY1_9ACTN|nr:hypothetical protein [Streptomyces sp. CWNU-1]MCM2389983.1 hypothetical protein [Streptomyces sp. CWNU-1]
MSEIAGTARVHEAYAFACMRCGHGWEQAYDIEHHMDSQGQEYVVYKAAGERVPSPLSSPTCMNCGGHVVRIMRAGQVSSVLDLMARSMGTTPTRPIRQKKSLRSSRPAGPLGTGDKSEDEIDSGPAAEPEQARQQGPPAKQHHWHLSDLLHPFHRR